MCIHWARRLCLPSGDHRAGSRRWSGRLTGVLLAGTAAGWIGIQDNFARQTSSPSAEARPAITSGPQAGVTCPAGAINISPRSNIQTLIDASPGTTTFCLKAGVHPISGAITPKSGNTFVGESGAVLDGTGWATDDPNQGAFRAHNADIDDVTIRNLVIRNMPQRGIHASHWASDRWTIEYNEISSNPRGVAAPSHSLIRHNYIHHNKEGGYSAYLAVDTTFEENDLSYNGPEQKMVGTTNVTFRNNFVHHNSGDGIWYDAENVRALIEGNIVEDNGRDGISFEISADGIIRSNTVRRSGSSGILIATSKNVEIYGNTLEDNFRGIQYFVNCGAVGGGSKGRDLANDTAHHNTVKINDRLAGALATVFMALRSCTADELVPYLNGSKNLWFRNNTYRVPSSSTNYWYWGTCCSKSWNEWQALGQDTTNVP